MPQVHLSVSDDCRVDIHTPANMNTLTNLVIAASASASVEGSSHASFVSSVCIAPVA